MSPSRGRDPRVHATPTSLTLLLAGALAVLSPSLAAAGTASATAGTAGEVHPTRPIDVAAVRQAPDRPPAPRAGDAPATDFLPPAQDLERVVHAAYARLAELTAAAGEGVEIALSDFRTLRRQELDEVLWTDLATLPSGDVVDVFPDGRSDGAGIATVQYRASWSSKQEEWMLTEDGRRMIGMTVADVLREVAREQPVYADVLAASRFEVRVRLGDRERTYRAAFLWRAGSEPGQAAFFALDHVLQGVEEAAREKRPMPHEAPLRLARIGAASTYATCEPSTDTIVRSHYQSGTNGHFPGGSHYSRADFSAICRCDSSCNSSCTARVGSPTCADTNVLLIDSCHKMSMAVDASSDWRGNATSSGAACAAGLACAQRACNFCACSFGVSVSILGISVSFGSNATPDWSGHLKFSATCPPCKQTCGSTQLAPDPWGGTSGGLDSFNDCGGGGTGGGGDTGGSPGGGDSGGGGADASGGGDSSCTDVYCEGEYAGEACGTSAQEMVDEAVEMCGGFE